MYFFPPFILGRATEEVNSDSVDNNDFQLNEINLAIMQM